MNYYLKDIDPELWRKVKSRAAAEGKSMKDVIIELLKKWLRERKWFAKNEIWLDGHYQESPRFLQCNQWNFTFPFHCRFQPDIFSFVKVQEVARYVQFLDSDANPGYLDIFIPNHSVFHQKSGILLNTIVFHMKSFSTVWLRIKKILGVRSLNDHVTYFEQRGDKIW